jgi:hypothetical protein
MNEVCSYIRGKWSYLSSDVTAHGESCGSLGVLAGDGVNVGNVQLNEQNLN